MKKKIFLIGSIVFIILVCIVMYLFGKVLMNNDVNDIMMTENDIEIETMQEKQKEIDNAHPFADYFEYLTVGDWILADYGDSFTDNFKNKFSNYIDIYTDSEYRERIWPSDATNLNDTGDKIRIEYTWVDENDKKKMSRVDYDLTLTDDGKIDDCKITNVIYYDPVTYNPLDGRPITLNIEDVRLYIGVLWRPGHYMLDEHVGDRIFKKYVDIPKSEDCQIINLPEEPLECEGNLPYFKAIYGKNKLSDDFEVIGIDISSIKYYKVEYDINDKAQFTRIEFKEITEDEYNKRGKS